MSPRMSQGLISYIEPQLDEPSIFHSLSSIKNKDHNQEKTSKCEVNSQGDNLGGWSDIQTISDTSQDSKQGTKTEEVYVHPLVKKSSFSLSSKSLEMCTEGLGSETGCNIVETIDELLEKLDKNHGLHISKSPKIAKKINNSVIFPPPLKSTMGSNGFKIKSYKEDGRLVLKAVTIPSIARHFQVERSDGKLRIIFLKNSSSVSCDRKSDEVHGADEEVEKSCDKHGDNNGDSENDGMDIDDKVGSEIEVGDLQRVCRCKGGNMKQVGREHWVAAETTLGGYFMKQVSLGA